MEVFTLVLLIILIVCLCFALLIGVIVYIQLDESEDKDEQFGYKFYNNDFIMNDIIFRIALGDDIKGFNGVDNYMSIKICKGKNDISENKELI